MNQVLDTFRARAAERLGPLWSVEPVDGGFVAKLDLRGRDTEPRVDHNGDALSEFTTDDYVILVDLDDRGGFSVRGRRIAGRRADQTITGPASYRRYFTGVDYSGSHREWTFERTPGGVVPTPGDPYNVTERENDLLAIGRSLGLTPARSAGKAVSGRLVLIIFGVVLLIIVGVGAIVITAVLSALA